MGSYTPSAVGDVTAVTYGTDVSTVILLLNREPLLPGRGNKVMACTSGPVYDESVTSTILTVVAA